MANTPHPTEQPTVPPTQAFGGPPAVPPPSAHTFPDVPGYEVRRELGRGGMGVVYEARQVSLGRPVALKMILGGTYADPSDTLRFFAEARTVAAIRHPNVVHIYEFAQHDGRPFIVMEYVDGGSVYQHLRMNGRRPAVEAATLVEKVARGVQAAHELGIIHRDLKPGNVLLDKAGNPKVTDFGLAKGGGAGGGLTRSGDVMGTPNYMAPEQARAQNKSLGPPTDVYALGVILYEALTGHVPFDGDDPIDILMRVVNDPPKPVRDSAPEVPRSLEHICLKCLEKDPARRYANAGELADALWAFVSGDAPTSAPGTLPPAKPTRTPAMPVWLIAVIAGAAVLTAGVGGFALVTLFGKPTVTTILKSTPATTPTPTPPADLAQLLASPDWEWGPPVSLGDGLNTAEEERQLAPSRDELTLVFLRGPKLFITQRANRTDPFPPAQALPDVVNDLLPLTPYLSGDGLELAFCSSPSVPVKQHVHLSKRATTADPFGPPERVADPLFPSDWEGSCVLSDDGLTLLLTARPTNKATGLGIGDITVTKRMARPDPFPPPELLPAPVNTTGLDNATWFSPDELILFRITKPKNSAVESLHYFVRKTPADPFGPPVPLDPFRGQFVPGKPWLSADGRRLYFHAKHPDRPDSDLWVSELQPKKK